MNNNDIVVIYQEVGKEPKIQKIKNDICEFENILGGKVDVIPYEDISVICRADRKNLKPNIYINSKFLSIGESIRGNIIISCQNNNAFKSLTKKQAMKCTEFLKRSSFNYDNFDAIRRYKTNKVKKQFIAEKTIGDDDVTSTANNLSQNINNTETLQMILAIQNAILQFIKNSEN